MGATLTTVNAISKDIYGPTIVNQLDQETVLLTRIEKTSEGTDSHQGGKFVTFPLKVRRNTGIGYRNELEQLQSPGQQGYTSVRVPLKYGYGRVHLSGQTMDLAEENFQAFSSALTEEMDGLKDDILKDTNRILWGNGLGVLGTIDAIATSTTLSFGTNADAVKYFDMDMAVDICNAAGAVQAANRIVTAINESTGDVTFSGAAIGPTAVGWIAVRTGNYNREPQGLTSLVSASGTLFTLDPAVEPLWKSNEDNTGGALSESRMIAMCDTIRTKGGKVTAIFTDLGTRRAYFNLLTTQRRFTDTKKFDGGLTGLAFSYGGREVPVVEDPDAPAGKMWFLEEPRFKLYRRKPWYFEDKDGGVWKWVNNFDAFEAFMKQYWEFAFERRNSHGVMTGITPG